MEMKKTYNITALILICLLSSSGCGPIMAASGTSGDLSSVSNSFPLGENREDAEDVLGSPDKICPRTSNDEQIIYYEFDTGIPPNPGDIPEALLCDILTFGICGAAIGSLMLYFDGPNGLMTVVYDQNNVVVNYLRYGSREYANSYGPEGYRPGIMDCKMITGLMSRPEIPVKDDEDIPKVEGNEMSVKEDCDPGMESCYTNTFKTDPVEHDDCDPGMESCD